MKPPSRTNRSTKSAATYFRRKTDTADTQTPTPAASSKGGIWTRKELQLLLRGLRKQMKVASSDDIDVEELQKHHAPQRSVQQIDSMLGTLKRTISKRAFNQARYQVMKDRHHRAPIQAWAELMERMAGGHEEAISAAFSRMLVIAGTEPRSLRCSAPPRPLDSPSTALSTAPSQTQPPSNRTVSRPDVISRPSPSSHVPTVPMVPVSSSTLPGATPFLSTALPLTQMQRVIMPLQSAVTQNCSGSNPAPPPESQNPSHTATVSNFTTGPLPTSHAPTVVMVPVASSTLPGATPLPSTALQLTSAIHTAPPPEAQPSSQAAAVSNATTSGPDKGTVISRPPSYQIPTVVMGPVASGALPGAPPLLFTLPKLTPAPGVSVPPQSTSTQPPSLPGTIAVSNPSVSCPDKDGLMSRPSQSSTLPGAIASLPAALQIHPVPGGLLVPPQLAGTHSASGPPSATYSSVLHSQVLNPGSTAEYDTAEYDTGNTVDFERIYSYLSAVSKGVSDCEGQLTAMECAVVLDLIMCLPEELPLLDCEGLRDHFLEMYSRLYTPAQTQKNKQATPQTDPATSATGQEAPQTEPATSSTGQEAPQTEPATSATGQAAPQTDQSAKPTEPSSVGTETSPPEPEAPRVKETWESIGVSPLNPLMVPLSLLGRKEKGS
ncbi:snRNA-activating protein complex subunit 2 [Engraulis encrasicolus]|uniref:snRNA-activating protein complex subunit 2 n=1 Tax=Engraulis encrasicolus TaxID=184585 RepID=UPI002FD77748